jgi:hypothetical protein
MQPEIAARLVDGDAEVIQRALFAAVEGPFFPDWEIATLVGLEREELAEIARNWPAASTSTSPNQDSQVVQWITVNNVLNSLLRYPHGRGPELESQLGVSIEDLQALLSRWRGDSAL